MTKKVTLEQVERLAAQLPVPERLKLVAHICEQLSAMQMTASGEKQARRASLAQVETWLAECDAIATGIEGEFDAAEDIRKIREERTNRL